MSEKLSSSTPSQVSTPVPTPVPAQVPPQVPAPAAAPAPKQLPKNFSHNSSFIVDGGIPVVSEALARLDVSFEVISPFKLRFSISTADDQFDVVVKQYIRADGQTIVEFHRISGCTAGFNMFLRGFLLEEMRNYGIATLAGDVVPRAYYPTLQ